VSTAINLIEMDLTEKEAFVCSSIWHENPSKVLGGIGLVGVKKLSYSKGSVALPTMFKECCFSIFQKASSFHSFAAHDVQQYIL
jgi:hypothetical protein